MGNCRSQITQTALGPIDLGDGVRIETPVILAPMSGVTDLPFRRTAKGLGAGMVVSEMIASWAMIRENRKTLDMAEVDGCGGTSAVQLAGCDPVAMAEAARIAVDRGADLVDINFGCPVKKVAVGQSAGSALKVCYNKNCSYFMPALDYQILGQSWLEKSTSSFSEQHSNC